MQVQKQQQLQLIAETDNVEEVIKQRKKDINQIESIMQNINAIAKDINIEVQTQGEKLQRLDQHMVTAANNVEAAKEELIGAEQHQKKGGRCLLYMIIAGVVCLAIVLTIVFTTGKK